MERLMETVKKDADPTEINALTRLRNEYWNRAVSYFRHDQLESAAETITMLLQACPHDAVAHAFLGSIYLRQYQIDEANEHLQQAVTIAPEKPFVHLKLAEYWIALGIPDRALEEMKKAELLAEDDLLLHDKIRTFSKELRRKTQGNIIRSAPAVPGNSFIKILEHMHLKRSSQSYNKGSKST